MDTTIRINRLKELPQYRWPNDNYPISKRAGNGCFLDAPGYPTYYTQNIYTRRGNEPRAGPTQVIYCDQDAMYYVTRDANDWKTFGSWEQIRANYDTVMRKIWYPLPIDHPRVRAWIGFVRGYFKGCYNNPLSKNPTHASDVLIGLPLKSPDKLWRIAVTLWPKLEGKRNRVNWTRLCIALHRKLDRATGYIRGFYPEYKPEQHAEPCNYGQDNSGWERA